MGMIRASQWHSRLFLDSNKKGKKTYFYVWGIGRESGIPRPFGYRKLLVSRIHTEKRSREAGGTTESLEEAPKDEEHRRKRLVGISGSEEQHSEYKSTSSDLPLGNCIRTLRELRQLCQKWQLFKQWTKIPIKSLPCYRKQKRKFCLGVLTTRPKAVEWGIRCLELNCGCSVHAALRRRVSSVLATKLASLHG